MEWIYFVLIGFLGDFLLMKLIVYIKDRITYKKNFHKDLHCNYCRVSYTESEENKFCSYCGRKLQAFNPISDIEEGVSND